MLSLYGYYFNYEKIGNPNYRSVADFIKQQKIEKEGIILCSHEHVKQNLSYYLKGEYRYVVFQDKILDLEELKMQKKIIVVGVFKQKFYGSTFGSKSIC